MIPAPTTAHDGADLRAAYDRLLIAFHDAVRRPLGVTPASGEEFYDYRMAEEAEARRPRIGTEDERAERPEVQRDRLTAALDAMRAERDAEIAAAYRRGLVDFVLHVDGTPRLAAPLKKKAALANARADAAEASLATAQAETAVLRGRVEAVEEERDHWRALYEQTDPNAPDVRCDCRIGECVRLCSRCRELERAS